MVLSLDNAGIGGEYRMLYRDDGSPEPPKEARIPLETGRGVRIGDSIAQVKEKLGKPRFERVMQGSGRTYLMRYQYDHPSKEKGDEGPIFIRYSAAYKFVNGKLWEIAFYEDLVGGG